METLAPSLLEVRNSYTNLNSKIEYIEVPKIDGENKQYKLKLTLYERIIPY